jgi:hypothetical protein
MRAFIFAIAVVALAGCGEAPEALTQAKQEAAALAKEAASAAAGAVDTRTACVVAGQSAAFCGCLQDELGPRIKGEHVEAVTAVLRRPIAGEPIADAAKSAPTIDAPTRAALVQCAAKGAVSEAASEAAN